MAIEISYRHEYLTGFAMAEWGHAWMTANVMAHNHGPFKEHVRVLGITLDEEVRFDSGDDDSLVAPHRGWLTGFKIRATEPGAVVRAGPAGYRVRILTTSTNLILSVGDPNGIGVKNISEHEPVIPFPYYGPNDFVVFTFPVRPPVGPPAGPVKNA